MQIHRVKKAQRRYRTVPVIDPETGQQKETLLFSKTGAPLLTKAGVPIRRGVTVEDQRRPLAYERCEACGAEIRERMPYKWIQAPQFGRRVRCAACPDWQVWEYSSSLQAHLKRLAVIFRQELWGKDPSGVQTALTDYALSLRSIAEQKRQGAANIVKGFGHPTVVSQRLLAVAGVLEDKAEQAEATACQLPPVPASSVELQNWRLAVGTLFNGVDHQVQRLAARQEGKELPVSDYPTGPKDGEPSWDTTALQRDFNVLGFQAPYVVVVRKSDNVRGTLEFVHRPRIYWNFVAE